MVQKSYPKACKMYQKIIQKAYIFCTNDGREIMKMSYTCHGFGEKGRFWEHFGDQKSEEMIPKWQANVCKMMPK